METLQTPTYSDIEEARMRRLGAESLAFMVSGEPLKFEDDIKNTPPDTSAQAPDARIDPRIQVRPDDRQIAKKYR